ncbi:hypothetical protein AXG93_3671s1040 [Marchantia polymorpha subsp. ruderalis]|uniref:Uncharacterized protein n=1 Tax=Marchantia polymorpha subsp. ruderalis TaxID=1480154 RepID=A0A176WJ67_MARPO|nr:hypothetical protein AXG93_3671s1040 [Marchantia polymorpha subsp. ruderalis]
MQWVGRCLHTSGVLRGAGQGNVRASKVKAVRGDFALTLRYQARMSEREELQSSQPAISKTQIEDMTLKKSEKVRKLVPLKVPYEELRPFRHELRELRLEFLLWNWNCVSASICKEVMDKSTVEGEELRGDPMLWTIKHWTTVQGPCAGSEGDLLFEKNSVGLTRGKEFSYGPPFETRRQGTNGWKIVNYKDPKRRAIALRIMHILWPARTIYVTAWQLGKTEMRSEESQRRMEKAEDAYRQLREDSTDVLRLRLEKCLNRFAMWGLDSVKWLKLNLLERRQMSAKTSGPVGHKQIVELVNSFSEELNEARHNVEVEIVNVLRRLGRK